jgi:hypothetical protein
MTTTKKRGRPPMQMGDIWLNRRITTREVYDSRFLLELWDEKGTQFILWLDLVPQGSGHSLQRGQLFRLEGRKDRAPRWRQIPKGGATYRAILAAQFGLSKRIADLTPDVEQPDT